MNNTPIPKELSRFERLLIAIDAIPLDAVWRVAAGFLVFPLTALYFGQKDSIGSSLLGLLVVLLSMRFLPFLIRKVFPFPESVQEVWHERRGTAKKYDSYQWKKILWIGVGMLFYVAASGLFWTGRIIIASACVLLGAIGTLRWRMIAPKAFSQ